jgi:hypothetical protein
MFLVCTWTLYTSFWKLPSWLFFLQAGEIFSIYAYAFVVNFLESVLLLLIALVPAFFLPRRWWTEAFIPKSFALILIVLGSALLHISLYRTPDTRAMFINGQFHWWVVTFLIAVFLTWLVGRVLWMRSGLESLADRFIIFLYIYLPLTAIGFLIVLTRILL